MNRRHALLLVALIGFSGCGSPPSVKVEIVSVNETGSKDAHWHTLQGPHTVVEDVATGDRRIVPGVYGDVGDKFGLGPKRGDL